MNTTVISEPTSATKMAVQNNKTKRSFSRANEAKLMTPAAAIYTMQGPGPIIETQRRVTNTKGKIGNSNVIGRKLNKTIEIEPDIDNI